MRGLGLGCLLGAAFTILGGGSVPAFAHVGFLLPDRFHVDRTDPEAARTTVTVQAAFSATFPNPDVALRSATLQIVDPDGITRPFDRAISLQAVTVLEATIDGDGLYRLTTGERLGRRGEVARLGEQFVLLGPDGRDAASLPEGTEILASQTATVSEAFVGSSSGETAPTDGEIETSGRLSIRLNDGDGSVGREPGARATVLFDGQPLAAATLFLVQPYGFPYPSGDGVPLVTDDTGTVALSFDRVGPHVLLVRHIALAPEGSETPVRSYATSLTINVDTTP